MMTKRTPGYGCGLSAETVMSDRTTTYAHTV